MVVLAWLVALPVFFAWWVLRLDTPDRNPFTLAKIYRGLALLLLIFVLVLGYKSVVWNRDLRLLILDTCR